MYKNLVANSPFIDIEFIESAKNLKNSDSENVFDYYKLKSLLAKKLNRVLS